MKFDYEIMRKIDTMILLVVTIAPGYRRILWHGGIKFWSLIRNCRVSTNIIVYCSPKKLKHLEIKVAEIKYAFVAIVKKRWLENENIDSDY